ncbi:MAG: DUF547 domain-containing protein [Formosa sp.]|jgi:hypothetical protein|nr:DUF547 domain-containing protein [Formosa sp.]
MIRFFTLSLIINFWAVNAQPLDYSLWTEILQKYVSDNGAVNYKYLKNNKSAFESYLKLLSASAPNEDCSVDIKKAYWINVYNAFTVQLIIENYPLKSIKDLRRPWDQSFIEIGGEKITLNTIEHKILRPMGDPRIHFAIVCASQSCPKLLNHAYEPSTLEDQLKNVTTVFINDPLKNNINKSSVKISKIFKWFKTDFPKREAFIAFLNSYSNIKILAQADVDYLNYNWGLNE